MLEKAIVKLIRMQSDPEATMLDVAKGVMDLEKAWKEQKSVEEENRRIEPRTIIKRGRKFTIVEGGK